MNPDRKHSSFDDIIDLYQRDVDVTLIRENLKLSPAERLKKLEQFVQFIEECRDAGRSLEQKRIHL